MRPLNNSIIVAECPIDATCKTLQPHHSPKESGNPAIHAMGVPGGRAVYLTPSAMNPVMASHEPRSAGISIVTFLLSTLKQV